MYFMHKWSITSPALLHFKFHKCLVPRASSQSIGFLQSKDPLKSITRREASAPALTSLLSQKFLLSKRKKSSSDPMVNFIRELHNDLEVVYVGQLCLSWEILHWQYEKALELWDSDPYGMRLYNEVAGEFQQFQVLLQRFIENEPFEGPRVQNYIKNRCVLRNLLQVPVIRGKLLNYHECAYPLIVTYSMVVLCPQLTIPMNNTLS